MCAFPLLSPFNQQFYVEYQKASSEKPHYLFWGVLFNYDVLFKSLQIYWAPASGCSPDEFTKKSHTKRCKAELSRVAAILEIMSERLNALLVEMTANQHTHTQHTK